MIKYILGLLFALLVLPQLTFAQDKDELRHVGKPNVPLCNTPGGPKRGQLGLGAPVVVQETRGQWVRVSVEGWIRASVLADPSSKLGKKGSRVLEKADSSLHIIKYEIEMQSEGRRYPRLFLKLFLKNKSDKRVSSWSALLVGQGANGEILFREPLTDNKANVVPNGVREVKFYWDAHEKPYPHLESAKKNSIALGLFKIRLQH